MGNQVCLGGQASQSRCACFTKETKFWQLMTCTPAAWTRSTCFSASLSKMRWKWPSCVSLGARLCICQTVPAMTDCKPTIRNEIVLLPMCMYECVQITLGDTSFLWMVGLYHVLTTLDIWQYFETVLMSGRPIPTLLEKVAKRSYLTSKGTLQRLI